MFFMLVSSLISLSFTDSFCMTSIPFSLQTFFRIYNILSWWSSQISTRAWLCFRMLISQAPAFRCLYWCYCEASWHLLREQFWNFTLIVESLKRTFTVLAFPLWDLKHPLYVCRRLGLSQGLEDPPDPDETSQSRWCLLYGVNYTRASM